jgi:hypothetical protein
MLLPGLRLLKMVIFCRLTGLLSRLQRLPLLLKRSAVSWHLPSPCQIATH